MAQHGSDGDNRGLAPYWMPYTANRAFKQAPRLVERAEGHFYFCDDGRPVLDTFSGLWTTGLGHCHPRIVAAVQEQVARLDYAHAFQVSHSAAFEVARRVTDLAPAGFTHCFFTNSGSEAADTALKIALGYHRLRGESSRTRFVGRERGYHGVNFGGMSVGGIPNNRHMFGGNMLAQVSHLPFTYSRERSAFTRGQPAFGADYADALDTIAGFHGPQNIAAVMVEPVAGSGGVFPPPQGYLERLRAACDRIGALLIYDEVITGFGRVGAPFAAERFGVVPDIITIAKGITNGVIPMGAVLVREEIYETFMQGPEEAVEFFHGYTYSGHPVACAAALASLDSYEEEDAFATARITETAFEQAIHQLDDARHVVDVRNFGLMGAVELEPRDGAPGARGMEIHKACFENGLLVRFSGDTLSFAPFLASEAAELDHIFATLGRLLSAVD